MLISTINIRLNNLFFDKFEFHLVFIMFSTETGFMCYGLWISQTAMTCSWYGWLQGSVCFIENLDSLLIDFAVALFS